MTPDSPSSLDPALLDRYLAGRCDTPERAHVDAWVFASPVRQMLVRELRTWQRDDAWTEQWLEQVKASAVSGDAIGVDVTDATAPKSKTRQHRHLYAQPHSRFGIARRTVAMGVALVTAVAVTVGVIRYTTTTPRFEHVSTYRTAAGERSAVTLSNGTRVVLGPSTSLLVHSSGRHAGVAVTVHGEALFRVMHRENAPFTVRAGHLMTRVLGTTFSVRRYDTDRAVKIVVVDGRVAVHDTNPDSPRRETILTAGTRGVAADAGMFVVMRDGAVARDTLWTTGQLVFTNTPTRDVLAELSRAYGVQFQLTDSTIARQPLTWSVSTTTEPLAGALAELAELLDSRFTRVGRVITIAPGRRSLRTPKTSPHSFTPEVHYGR